MSSDDFPENVKAFINDHIRSLVALELLLRLHADSTKAWSASELARELRASPTWAQQELKDLVNRGLARETQSGSGVYSFQPTTPELGDAVSQLAALYPERRFTIIQILYSAPRAVQNFADAFKLRKEPP